MSRSGYVEDGDHLNLYRGAVQRAIRGKRGQKLLREMGAAMDAMPVKELVAGEIQKDGQVCALGAVAAVRGLDVAEIDITDGVQMGKAFGIARALALEIAYENDDDDGCHDGETPAERWVRMRKWVNANVLPVEVDAADAAPAPGE